MTRTQIETLLQRPPSWLKHQVEGILRGKANSGDIEDIVQDAIETVILNFERQGCRTVREVHGYLKSIAHNKAIDLLRDKYVQLRDWSLTVEEEDEAENEQDSYLRRKLLPMGRRYDPWESIELGIDVRRAMRKLSLIEREIAELYAEDVPLRDAAKITGKSKSTIQRWWHRVIAPTLRRELKGYAGDSLSYLLRKEREVTAKVEGWRAA